MNLAHVHLLLNHFPTIGMIVGLGLFLSAIAAKSDDLKRASLVIFFSIALLSIPTFATGTAAELALSKNPEVSKTAIEAHETAAFEALGFMELTGALAWLGLWQYRRLSRCAAGDAGGSPAGGAGDLRPDGPDRKHRRGDPAPGDSHGSEPNRGRSAVETATAQPLARVIGDAMVNLKWGWPASETVHFIGLSLLFGVVLLVDLRMLGFLKGIPYSTLHRLLPWGVLGFGVNVVTGILFFIGAPPDFYVDNPVFIWKLALDPGGGSQRLVLHRVRAGLDPGSRRHPAHGGESGGGVWNLTVDGRDLLRSDVAVFRPLILMVGTSQMLLS